MKKQRALKTGSYKLWNGRPIYNGAFQHFYWTLYNIALMRYKWNNLPSTVSQRFLEIGLLQSGVMAFFEDDIGDLRALNMTYSAMDMVNDPTRFTVYSYNYSAERNIWDAVPCWANWIRIPDILIVNYYAELLADMRTSIVVNTKAQKTPIMIVCDNKERLTMENLYQKYEGGAPVIYGYKNNLKSIMDDKGEIGINVLKTDAPFIAPEIRIMEQDYWMEALTALGVDTTNRTKKERFINSEMVSDKGELEAMRKVGLIPRQECAEKVNRMFGTNITVEYNTEVDILDYLNTMLTVEERGEFNVGVHNTDKVDTGNGM